VSQPILTPEGDDLVLRVKAVPGAKRDAIAGPLGDRLKIRVAAPPEKGRANEAMLALLARTLGAREADLTIESGPSSPEKTVRLRNVAETTARDALGL